MENVGIQVKSSTFYKALKHRTNLPQMALKSVQHMTNSPLAGVQTEMIPALKHWWGHVAYSERKSSLSYDYRQEMWGESNRHDMQQSFPGVNVVSTLVH